MKHTRCRERRLRQRGAQQARLNTCENDIRQRKQENQLKRIQLEKLLRERLEVRRAKAK